MNWIRSFSVGTLLIFAVGVLAQQTSTTPGPSSAVEEPLKVIAETVDLTASQRAKVRPQREQADKKMRALLSDDQKKKLDQYLAGPHGEMHELR